MLHHMMILISVINILIVLLFPSLYTGTLASLVHLVLVTRSMVNPWPVFNIFIWDQCYAPQR